MPESIQKTLTRVRPPRVRITYDVETGDAIIKKELPFVLGIMADLSGSTSVPRENPLPPYKERPFVFIDRDNFDDVLKDARPAVQLSSKGKPVLFFSGLDDFTPARVVQQIAPLKAQLDARNRLQDLAAKLDGNDAAHDALVALLKQENMLSSMQEAIQAMQAKRKPLQETLDARMPAPDKAGTDKAGTDKAAANTAAPDKAGPDKTDSDKAGTQTADATAQAAGEPAGETAGGDPQQENSAGQEGENA